MKNFKQLIVLIILFIIIINLNYSSRAEENKAYQKVFSPNGCNFLYYEESFNKKTKLFVYNEHLQKTVTIAEVYIRYSLDKGILWHNDDLLEINIKTGSPGNFSIFYSVNNNKISEELYFPLAVYPNKYLVLLGQEDVYITSIFDTKYRYKIDLDFQKTAIKWLIFDRKETYFDKNGNLFLKYKNNNNEWVTKQLEKIGGRIGITS